MADMNQPTPKPPATMKKGVWIAVGVIVIILIITLLASGSKETTNTSPTNTAGTTTNTGGATTTNTSGQTNATPTADFDTYKKYAGSWSGTWKNTTFGSTGAMKATVTIESDGKATMKLDVDGLVWGTVNPKEKSFNGTWDASGVTFSGTGDDVFGDLTMTFKKGGGATISGLKIPATNVDTLNASGTITETELDLTYNVSVGGAEFAKGTIAMSKS